MSADAPRARVLIAVKPSRRHAVAQQLRSLDGLGPIDAICGPYQLIVDVAPSQVNTIVNQVNGIPAVVRAVACLPTTA